MKASLINPKAVIYGMGCIIIIGVTIVMAVRPAAPAFWVGAVIFGFGGLASLLSLALGRKRKENIFADRPNLSDEEIYQQNFSENNLPKELVLELWHEAASVFGVPAGKLRPTDRLGEDLGAYAITSEELDALAAIAMARAKKQNVELDLIEIKTLDGYIRRMVAVESQ